MKPFGNNGLILINYFSLFPIGETCIKDESLICQDASMMRYCIIPDYRKKCCQSCANYSGQ